MRPRFSILKVLGDVLDEEELHFLERAKPLKPEDGVSKRSQRPRQVSTSVTIKKRENGSSLPQSPRKKPSYYSGQEPESATV